MALQIGDWALQSSFPTKILVRVTIDAFSGLTISTEYPNWYVLPTAPKLTLAHLYSTIKRYERNGKIHEISRPLLKEAIMWILNRELDISIIASEVNDVDHATRVNGFLQRYGQWVFA